MTTHKHTVPVNGPSTGSRDAVETAIDLSRQANPGTWENPHTVPPGRILKWGIASGSERVAGAETPTKPTTKRERR